ncbi:MAG: Fe-S protein assembly chaperone HscA [Rickettsiales bacterium]|nr:Fe-S protein assembly chaperone HscA [Rickettsiales bacterium]|tara:strand:+ start:29156 stop:30949 length:1794 start_codon:yes stop_codon:yes gene_type:complete
MVLQIMEPGQAVNVDTAKKAKAVGIDLGTTHSLVAINDGEKTKILEINQSTIVPSIVALVEEEFEVGQAAKTLQKNGHKVVVSSVKRLMDPDMQQPSDALPVLDYLPYQPGEMARFKIGERLSNPIEISAEILKYLKKKTQEVLGEEVDQAVITVPAYFSERARGATRLAAKLAGWKVLRLISEPTAAAIQFGLNQQKQGLYLVFDLGGGTFDVSILNLENQVFQVVATGGDTLMGGDDVDQLIAADLKERYGLETIDKTEEKNLLAIAEDLKKQLSEVKTAEKNGHFQGQNRHFLIDFDHFSTLLRPFLSKIEHLLNQVLKSARLTKSDIKDCLLVGGSTRLKPVQNFLEKYFGKKPLTDLHPDHVVAEGAAIQARALTHGSASLLLDVIPLSLGLETMGGIVEKIIPRNSPIPAQVTQEFTTFQDNQTGMSIHVVQGEREMVADCRSLGKFSLKGIPPLPAGFAKIEVTFDVDADGLLTVSAQEKTTGAYQAIEVQPGHGLTTDEMEQMVFNGFQSAEVDMEARAKGHAWVKLQFVLKLCQKILQAKKEQPSGLADQKLQALVDEAAILTKEHGTTDMFREYANRLENYFKSDQD